MRPQSKCTLKVSAHLPLAVLALPTAPSTVQAFLVPTKALHHQPRGLRHSASQTSLCWVGSAPTFWRGRAASSPTHPLGGLCLPTERVTSPGDAGRQGRTPEAPANKRGLPGHRLCIHPQREESEARTQSGAGGCGELGAVGGTAHTPRSVSGRRCQASRRGCKTADTRGGGVQRAGPGRQERTTQRHAPR